MCGIHARPLPVFGFILGEKWLQSHPPNGGGRLGEGVKRPKISAKMGDILGDLAFTPLILEHLFCILSL